MNQKPGHTNKTPARAGVRVLGGQHALPVIGTFTTVREHGGGPRSSLIFGSGTGQTPVQGKSVVNRGSLSLG